MVKTNIKETNDSELIMLYHENNEDAKNILFLKYNFIINILIKKYNKIFKTLNVDSQEIYSECNVGFSDAIRSYQEDKDASLATFITLCVERKLIGLIKKYNREKYKILNQTYSLDFLYKESARPLIEILGDNTNEPLFNMTERENYIELVNKIKNILSKKENEVFVLMIRGFDYIQIANIVNNTPKQIDNAMQRIKNKIKRMLNK